MGLCVLPKVKDIILERKNISELYMTSITNPYISIPTKEILGLAYNFAYFPIIFSSEEKLLMTRKVLEEHSIFTRRYFYPSLNKLSYLNKSDTCPISESISNCVLCLPLYYGLNKENIEEICNIINNVNY